ncbi:MAG: DUF6525 family protein [Alkalilacustris sp.]
MRAPRNLATRLPRRPLEAPMRAFDRLPADLRVWLHGAVLPWSPRSALRLWRKALSETGDPLAARARLDAAEARMLARDAPFGPAGQPAVGTGAAPSDGIRPSARGR